MPWLGGARSPRAFQQLQDELDALHQLRIDVETMAIARTAQRELAAMSRHRIPVSDLLIASCAQQHQAGVLHVDRHYETLARVLSFTAIRLDTQFDA